MDVAIILNAPDKIALSEVSEERVIYADGGYKSAKEMKGKITLAVIGDFDTLTFIPENENIVLLEREKNFTDGERAVCYAKEIGAEKISIYGAFGGKPEHVLGNLSLLKIARKAGVAAEIKYGGRSVRLLDSGEYSFGVKKGGSVSLIPFGENAAFGKSKGLYYPLDGLTLTSADTRGISNVATESEISFSVLSGETLIVYEY